jgi:hypothetical protein
VLDGVGGQRHAPAALLSGLTRKVGGPQAGLEGAENLTPTDIRSPDYPALASRYTDYALPAHSPTAEVCIIAICV